MKMKRAVLAVLLMVSSSHVLACELTWDEPADIGVVPCATCVYTATFYRGLDESAQSDPLAVTIDGVPQFGTITLSAQ